MSNLARLGMKGLHTAFQATGTVVANNPKKVGSLLVGAALLEAHSHGKHGRFLTLSERATAVKDLYNKEETQYAGKVALKTAKIAGIGVGTAGIVGLMGALTIGVIASRPDPILMIVGLPTVGLGYDVAFSGYRSIKEIYNKPIS